MRTGCDAEERRSVREGTKSSQARAGRTSGGDDVTLSDIQGVKATVTHVDDVDEDEPGPAGP